MWWEFPKTMPESTTRAAARHDFAVPMIVELRNGPFRRADRVDALLVDLSDGGAALVIGHDRRLRQGVRLRVVIDDHDGIVSVRNVTDLPEGQVRVGVGLTNLGLELQELVADTLENARGRASRVDRSHDPFVDAVVTADDLETEAEVRAGR